METFKIKGKKNLRAKAKALKLLYKDLKENVETLLPKNFKPWKLLKALTVVRAFSSEQERDKAYNKSKNKSDLTKDYQITVKDMK